MLIPFSEIIKILRSKNINVSGILHIGAHKCEELSSYMNEGIEDTNIAWIDAQAEFVEEMKQKGIKNIHAHCILDVETTVPFWKTTNGESSSVLEFNTHSIHHPHVQVCGQESVETITLKHFLDRYPEYSKFNFWNLDIQGVELRALKSAEEYINNVNAIYTEVNTEEVYENCDQMDDITEFLKSKGFRLAAYNIYKEYGWGDALYIRI
jgi:FkbM family methyltransferase